MTENELKKTIAIYKKTLEVTADNGETCFRELDKNTLLFLEELEQYRAIGTVEEIRKKMEELERWHTDRINENIKNPFAYTSTMICHNCDHKDEYIEELEAEVEKYRGIGTVEELQALKEKNEPKKVKEIHCDEYYCPSCGSENNCCDAYKVGDKFCPECGQAIDAREEEEYE